MTSSNQTGILGLEQPSIDEFLAHPDFRQIAAFFLGWVFISSFEGVISSTLVRSLLRGCRACLIRNRKPADNGFSFDGLQYNEKVPYTKPDSDDTELAMQSGHSTLVLALSICFMFASIAYSGSLLTFYPDAGAAGCAFLVAWGGMAQQSARLLGLIMLMLDLKRLGIKTFESAVLWIILIAGIGLIFANNAISTGATIVSPQLSGMALCYRRHFLPTSLASSLLYVCMEIYICARLIYFVAPPFLRSWHRLSACNDIRILRAIALLILELVTIVPGALFINMIGEFVPFSVGAMIVLSAFKYQTPVAEELVMNTIPPSVNYTNSNRGSVAPSTRTVMLTNHPYATSASRRDEEGWHTTRTAHSSRSIDSATARSIKNAVVSLASKATPPDKPAVMQSIPSPKSRMSGSNRRTWLSPQAIPPVPMWPEQYAAQSDWESISPRSTPARGSEDIPRSQATPRDYDRPTVAEISRFSSSTSNDTTSRRSVAQFAARASWASSPSSGSDSAATTAAKENNARSPLTGITPTSAFARRPSALSSVPVSRSRSLTVPGSSRMEIVEIPRFPPKTLAQPDLLMVPGRTQPGRIRRKRIRSSLVPHTATSTQGWD